MRPAIFFFTDKQRQIALNRLTRTPVLIGWLQMQQQDEHSAIRDRCFYYRNRKMRKCECVSDGIVYMTMKIRSKKQCVGSEIMGGFGASCC